MACPERRLLASGLSPGPQAQRTKGAGQTGVGHRPRQGQRLAENGCAGCALADGHLVLYCQPILDLSNNEISQYEMLVRLHTAWGDLLQPGAFLPAAERQGTILLVDCWVVRQAIALIAAQARLGHAVTLNVNVSAKSIRQPRLLAVIDRALATNAVDPARLVLELTETAAIRAVQHAKTFMASVKSRGCQLALDDFGSGNASFNYVKHLPFDYFKIGGDFTRGFGANSADSLLVKAIVGIAKGMGKKTIAEWVTDEGTRDRLWQSGIDFAQGFHIGRPQPVADIFRRS